MPFAATEKSYRSAGHTDAAVYTLWMAGARSTLSGINLSTRHFSHVVWTTIQSRCRGRCHENQYNSCESAGEFHPGGDDVRWVRIVLCTYVASCNFGVVKTDRHIALSEEADSAYMAAFWSFRKRRLVLSIIFQPMHPTKHLHSRIRVLNNYIEDDTWDRSDLDSSDACTKLYHYSEWRYSDTIGFCW